MVIDGKKLSLEIQNSLREEIAAGGYAPRLAIVQVGKNPVTEKFLEQKKKFGAAIGAPVEICCVSPDVSTGELTQLISNVGNRDDIGGIIVQLPLPPGVDTNEVLDAIPPEKDPDRLSSVSVGLLAAGFIDVLPPVVGAIRHIVDTYQIELLGKHAVVVGSGRLVGLPAALWLSHKGATVTVLNKYTKNATDHTIRADLIVSGAGQAGLIMPHMVREGVAVIDCGTSESHGRVVGDVDPRVAEAASLFSPVPGGVGPLTVAMLFSNLFALSRKKKVIVAREGVEPS